MADWEAEAEREETLEAREAAAREEAAATPGGRAADGQSKISDPGGVCFWRWRGMEGCGGGAPLEAAQGAAGGSGGRGGRASVELSADWHAQFDGV